MEASRRFSQNTYSCSSAVNQKLYDSLGKRSNIFVMATENKPVKGILKSSTSFDKDGQHDAKKSAQFDEMNILATYHPADKDYGHKKIDEPPTPYNHMSEGEGECDTDEACRIDELDPQSLAARLEEDNEPKAFEVDEDEVESDEDLDETEEERAKRKFFESKRKMHYNEFQAVKLARQLMDDDEEEDEEDIGESSHPPGVIDSEGLK